MKVIFFAVALILLLPYSHASSSGYKKVSTQVFTNSTLYQDLFSIGFDYTLQKATYGGGNNTLPEQDWSYSNDMVTVAVKNQSGVLYLQGLTNLTENSVPQIFTFVVRYKRLTGQISVTNMSWYTPTLPPGFVTSGPILCSRCASIIRIPSASDAAFSYAFNHTISQAIKDRNLPNSTYKLGQIFSAWYGGGSASYDYIYTVVGGPNKYTYRLESSVGAPLISWGSDEELLDAISLYSYRVEAK